MGAVLMAWRAACPGCAQGDHMKHVRDWNITPGLIGGAWCDCPGEPECTERFRAFAERLTQQLGFDPVSRQDNRCTETWHDRNEKCPDDVPPDYCGCECHA